MSPRIALCTLAASSSVSDWSSIASVTPPRRVTRPASGSSRPASIDEQAGLAVAVASDDADPVALVEADGDAVEHHTGRIFEVERFRSEEMGHYL